MLRLDVLQEKLAVAVKKGDLWEKIFCLFLIKIGFSNEKLQTLEIRNRKYLYIKKRYLHVIEKFSNIPSAGNGRKKIIWILWLQGEERAPQIVKKCIHSIRKNASGYTVRLLDENNLFNYVKLPDYIILKWKRGIISNTHFSDIVRTDLLVRHGGIWMDATVFLTGELPNYIVDSPFFLYKRGMTRDITAITNNWLISSDKNVRLLLCVREMLFEYWKTENKIREYFLWHLCMTIAIEKYSDDWKKVLWIPDVLPEIMRWNIFSTNKGHWNEVIKISNIHKLSYKINCPDETKGTIYDHIMTED